MPANRLLRSFGLIAFVGAMLTSPLLLWPQSGPPSDAGAAGASLPERKPWWNAITTNGYLSLSYTHDTNNPEPHLNQFRVFDFNDDNPQLDAAQLVVQHPASEPHQFGFRLNLLGGSGVPEVTASYGLFRDTHTGIAHHFDIPEAFISYVVPVGKGLRLDAGKFVTHMGYEVIGGYDGYNDNFSRSYLFGYGVPFTHTGLKASYSFNNRLSSAILITNGCDAVQNLNGTVTVGGQFTAATSRNTSLTFNFLQGAERPHNSRDQRSVMEITGTWKVVPRFSLGLDALYGHEDQAAIGGGEATWRGLSGYSKYKLTKALSLAFRGEVFDDIGGSRTGVQQLLQGFTLTPEYDLPAKFSQLSAKFKRIDGQFAIRGEFRQDFSDHPSFRKGADLTTRQFTTAVNLIYLF